ncbi:ScbA/BarX family gamma-butyrolactone biosynthesis protein [Streptomyces lichenis]|uniref:Transcriptional regulator n=1 Tax=Streptomyces lichenis TaxID=2306967 RepID=A0ABT0I3V5_9ACTN|nr:ScbA/BarX family gamma-butyrolactone biosynthesis protein [Streptomyces lichenis]MCK8676007.1 transcriptional regulator [Streptomyces lichenis]
MSLTFHAPGQTLPSGPPDASVPGSRASTACVPTARVPGGSAPASSSGPVTAALIHKADPEEVLLTTWRRTGENAFVFTARWPRTHGFYVASDGCYTPALFAETVRQTFSALTHAAYGVPFGYQLIWDALAFEVSPAALYVGPEPAALTLHVGCDATRSRRGVLTAASLEVTVERNGMLLGTARTRFTVHPAALYARLRRARTDARGAMAAAPPAPAPLDPAAVGRTRAADVVLGAEGGPDRRELRVDTTHPVLFDHPVDHVPGMLLVEGVQQAAVAALGPDARLRSLSISFLRFAELDAPCHLSYRVVRPGPDAPGAAAPVVQVEAEQDGEPVFTATATGTAEQG